MCFCFCVCVCACVCVCLCLCVCRLHVRTEGVWHTFVFSNGEPADTIFKCRHDFQNCRNRRVDCKFGLSVARRVSGDVRSRHLGHRMRGTRLNVKCCPHKPNKSAHMKPQIPKMETTRASTLINVKFRGRELNPGLPRDRRKY